MYTFKILLLNLEEGWTRHESYTIHPIWASGI